VGFVPRVTLPRRHATDQTCDLKDAHQHVDYMSEQVPNPQPAMNP